jgi:HemY protein
MGKLAALRPDHRESRRALGRAALDAGLWKEARSELSAAVDYRALAKLEHTESRNDAAAGQWLEKAADQLPDPRWICTSCGHAAADWTALCLHCGAFDNLEWMTPSADGMPLPRPAAALTGDAAVLSPPA